MRAMAQDEDRVLGVNVEAVRLVENTLAPVIEHPARAIEDHVWMLGAGIDVDVVSGVARHTGDLAPPPAIGELSPPRHQLIPAIASFDRNHLPDPPSSVS